MDPVAECLHRSLREAGFKLGKGVYQRNLAEVIHLAKVAKSRFSGEHLVDIGLVLKGAPVDRSLSVPALAWHVDARADDLLPDPGATANLLNSDLG